MNELRLTNDAMVLLPGVKEAMNADFYRAVISERIDLKRSRHQLALYFAAKIIFDGFQNLDSAQQQSILVMIKLCIVGPEGCLAFHIAPIVGIEHVLIQLQYRLKERVRCGRAPGSRR